VCVYKKAQHNLKEAWLSVKTLVHRQRTWQKYFTLLISKTSPSPLSIESIYLFCVLLLLEHCKSVQAFKAELLFLLKFGLNILLPL
jgi:hypothetical protein